MKKTHTTQLLASHAQLLAAHASSSLPQVDPPKKGSVLSDLGQQKVDKDEAARYDFQAANLHQVGVSFKCQVDVKLRSAL